MHVPRSRDPSQIAQPSPAAPRGPLDPEALRYVTRRYEPGSAAAPNLAAHPVRARAWPAPRAVRNIGSDGPPSDRTLRGPFLVPPIPFRARDRMQRSRNRANLGAPSSTDTPRRHAAERIFFHLSAQNTIS